MGELWMKNNMTALNMSVSMADSVNMSNDCGIHQSEAITLYCMKRRIRYK